MTLIQAILLGGLYWLSYCGFGCHSLNLLVLQPLPVSVLVGLILGDIPTAMIIGATIQPMYRGRGHHRRPERGKRHDGRRSRRIGHVPADQRAHDRRFPMESSDRSIHRKA